MAQTPVDNNFQITFLQFDNDLATILYHTFVALCYLFPLLGGILSDSYWGKVKTIIILGKVQAKLISFTQKPIFCELILNQKGILYFVGMLILTIGAIPQLGSVVEGYPIPGDVNRILTYIGLFIMALGNGGIKPCVSSLGGDQFTGQERIH